LFNGTTCARNGSVVKSLRFVLVLGGLLSLQSCLWRPPPIPPLQSGADSTNREIDAFANTPDSAHPVSDAAGGGFDSSSPPSEDAAARVDATAPLGDGAAATDAATDTTTDAAVTDATTDAVTDAGSAVDDASALDPDGDAAPTDDAERDAGSSG
jgi:hypothetical protein